MCVHGEYVSGRKWSLAESRWHWFQFALLNLVPSISPEGHLRGTTRVEERDCTLLAFDSHERHMIGSLIRFTHLYSNVSLCYHSHVSVAYRMSQAFALLLPTCYL